MISCGRTRHAFWIALIFSLLLASGLLIFGGTPASHAAANPPPVQARTVQGVLRGNQSAQIWLELTPEFADAQIKVIAEWDRDFPAANGLNFFIFDEQQLRRLDNGRAAFSAIALAAGNPRFELTTPDNAIGAGFNATGWASYALVLSNESPVDATFTLRVTNAFLIDTAAQVTPLDSAPFAPPLSTITSTVAPSALLTTSDFITALTFLTTTWAPPTVTATAVATPLVTPVATATITATGAPLPVMAAPPPLTVAPQARSGVSQNKRLTRVNGALAEPSTQQVLRLKPTKANGQILLRLVADRQPTATSERSDVLNFWVFDETGFRQYLTGIAPSRVAISAGKPIFRSATNQRVAGFRATSVEPYIVVIYSVATLPVSYTFSVEGVQVLENFYMP